MEQDINAVLKSVWSEWEVVSLLGTGTYGCVYQIRREYPIASSAALKVMEIPAAPENGGAGNVFSKTNTAFDFFANEAGMLGRLQNAPHVVGIQDYTLAPFPDGGGCFLLIRMELLQPISSLYPFSEEDCINLGMDICMALSACHEKGILHRDIKPGNIMYSEYGGYKLTDFGIAKMMDYADNAMTSGRGTLEFMAPEVFSLKSYDFRSDLYGLGLVLYYLVNGCRLPFLRTDQQVFSPEDMEKAFQQRMRGMPLPRPAGCSENFYDILRRACAVNPKKRFASAAEMLEALSSLQKDKKKYTGKTASYIKTAVSSALISGVCFFTLALLLSRFGMLPLPREQQKLSAAETVAASAEQIPSEAVPFLRLLAAPARLEYICGETLDTTGLLLSVTDENGRETKTAVDFSCEPETLDTLGSVEVTVRYRDLSVSFFVNVTTPLTFEKAFGDDGWTVTGITETTLPFVRVPAFYCGEPVIRIGDRAFEKLNVRTVILPKTVGEIGSYAFYQSNIEEISLPAGLRVIKDSAFYKCGQLRAVHLPESLETIGSFAFELCDQLPEVELPEGLLEIGNAAFQGCGELKTLTVPESVRYLGEAAFLTSENLKTVVFLGDAPFYDRRNGHPLFCVSAHPTIYYDPQKSGWTDPDADTPAMYEPQYPFLPLDEQE